MQRALQTERQETFRNHQGYRPDSSEFNQFFFRSRRFHKPLVEVVDHIGRTQVEVRCNRRHIGGKQGGDNDAENTVRQFRHHLRFYHRKGFCSNTGEKKLAFYTMKKWYWKKIEEFENLKILKYVAIFGFIISIIKIWILTC